MESQAERIWIFDDRVDGDLREAVRDQALALGLTGWVMRSEPGGLEVHAEGEQSRRDRLAAWLQARPEVDRFERRGVKTEGHEQFAIRGVPAGSFVVREHRPGEKPHYELWLEVDGAMRSWILPRAPSLDPSVKRFATQGADHDLEPSGLEDQPPAGTIAIWDQGVYERRGRVAWPQALERGHAMFYLHGNRLTGGFALQRTGSGWLLIKRRDEHARRAPAN